MSDATQSVVTVINPVEGKRFKMSMKGEVSRLSIRKLKKYLAASSGILPDEQVLKYNGVELGDDVLGGEVGITTGSTLTVERRAAGSAPFLASPQKQALEMETLDQQRAMLQHERMRRDEEFRRQQEALVATLAQAEKRRVDVERERVEKEAELVRLREMEAAAAQERARLADARRVEAEREALRARDLEARKEQLSSERALQRQMEMQKLENERKKMLLLQQRSELESERARLERERREYQERVKRQELAIREREVEMERLHIDAERNRRELEAEKLVLAQQRAAEFEALGRERGQHDALSQQRQWRGIRGSGGGSAGGFGGGGGDFGGGGATPQAFGGGGGAGSAAALTPRASAVADKERELERLRRERDATAAAHERTVDQLLAMERASSAAAAAAAGQGAHGGTPLSGARPAAASSGGGGGGFDTAAASAALRAAHAAPVPASAASVSPTRHHGDARVLALEQLAQLAADLGVPSLALDDNNTAVVSVEDRYTLLITFDPATERLYLYSTLTTFIPTNPETKLRLYEFLLEGALLGRDMCGGGVGASLKNNFILLSTSIFLPKAAPSALRTIAPHFVDTLVKWRARVKDLLSAEDEGLTSDSTVVLGAGDRNGADAAGYGSAPSHAYGSTSSAALAAAVAQQYSGGSEYPLLGVEVTDGVTIDGVHSRYSDGVIVVSSKGPAGRAGILPNDYLRAINGRRVASLRDFQDAVRSLRPGSLVPVTLDRAGSSLVVSVLVAATKTKPGDARYRNIVRVNGDAAGGGGGGSVRRSVSPPSGSPRSQ